MEAQYEILGDFRLFVWMVCLAFGHGYRPEGGYLPDSSTAVKIAEAVLTPVYGKDQIALEQPFNAKLKNDVWTVSGTLCCPDGGGGISAQCDGGVAVVQISKVDAHIISTIHYK
jgi:hypothetical protein